MRQPIDVQKVLAIVVPLTFIAEVACWQWIMPAKLDSSTREMLSGLLGLHAGWAAMIVGYYFNSSASSAKKDEIIARSTPVEAARDTATTIMAAAANSAPKTPPVVPPFTTPPTTEVLDEAKSWSDAVDANTVLAFEGYLLKFPASVHAVEAKARIVALQNP